MPQEKPRCLQCAHYFITHDTYFPYGCQALNFKSRALPHKEVELASGLACQMYQPRPPVRGKPTRA